MAGGGVVQPVTEDVGRAQRIVLSGAEIKLILAGCCAQVILVFIMCCAVYRLVSKSISARLM